MQEDLKKNEKNTLSFSSIIPSLEKKDIQRKDTERRGRREAINEVRYK